MKRKEKRRADIPVRYCANEAGWKTQTEGGHSCPPHKAKAGWKTRPPVIEAEARETDKALKEILEKIGI